MNEFEDYQPTPEQLASWAQAEKELEERQAAQARQYEAWKQELEDILSDPEGDENDAYRIQCLRADIFAYEEAKAAIERGDEFMAENPYERGLTN